MSMEKHALVNICIVLKEDEKTNHFHTLKKKERFFFFFAINAEVSGGGYTSLLLKQVSPGQ